MKEKLNLGMDEKAYTAKMIKLESLLHDINKLRADANTFGEKVPVDIQKIIPWMNAQLREQFKSGLAKPEKIAEVIGKEREYYLVSELYQKITANRDYLTYENYIIYDKANFQHVFDERLIPLIEEQCTTFLVGEKAIKAYTLSRSIISNFYELMDMANQPDVLRESKKFASGSPFLSCGFDFKVVPNIEYIRSISS